MQAKVIATNPLRTSLKPSNNTVPVQQEIAVVGRTTAAGVVHMVVVAKIAEVVVMLATVPAILGIIGRLGTPTHIMSGLHQKPGNNDPATLHGKITTAVTILVCGILVLVLVKCLHLDNVKVRGSFHRNQLGTMLKTTKHIKVHLCLRIQLKQRHVQRV